MPKDENKSSLSEKLVAAWLKYDPFVRLVAKDNDRARYDAMLAMAGEKPAQKFFGVRKKYQPLPKLIFPSDVRRREQEFLDDPDKRTRIIRELIYWGRDEYLNTENIDSHLTRLQIIQALLGIMFLNSDSAQERLIIDGLKVLVLSRETSLGKTGEQSPLVHQEIIDRVAEILRYNEMVLKNKIQAQSEKVLRAQLLKTIQGLKESTHRSAYYVADDQKRRPKTVAERFPLNSETEAGLLDIVRHYTYSVWPEIKSQAQSLLKKLDVHIQEPV